MRGFIAFTKKELIENTRNFRLLIILGVFVFFGISGPIMAKLMPEIVKAFAPDLELLVPPPTALDAWAQFYKNISQIGFGLVTILFSSCLSNEYNRGTLTIMLTKGLSRNVVILAKLTSAVLITTLCYWICFFLSYGYTAYLWPDAKLPNVFFAALSLWIIGLLYLCILILGCVLFRQSFTCLLFLLIIVTGLSLSGFIPQLSEVTPAILASQNMNLLTGAMNPSEFFIPMLISIILSFLLLIASLFFFRKKSV